MRRRPRPSGQPPLKVPSIYVHALSDAPVVPWEESDGRRIESIPVSGIFAIGERRADLPPISEQELHRQHDIVHRIAEAAPAALPARFGSLIDEAELAAVVNQRLASIQAAFALVRDKVQMTLRFAAPERQARSAPTAASGSEYLKRRREEMFPPVPPRSEDVLRALRAFVVDERRKASEDGQITVYHLVRRRDVDHYRAAVSRAAVDGMSATGPFPAFAFAPEF